MVGDGPQAGLFVYGSPELLGNPGHSAAGDGPGAEAVREQGNIFFSKYFQRGGVEAVARRNPDAGIESMSAQNGETTLDFTALAIFG